MAITKLSGSSLTNITKYDSFLAGNPSYVPPSFESIATQTLGTAASSVTFSSIPSTYKHLQLRMLARCASQTTGNATNVYLTLNSDSGANYTYHYLYGQGSSVSAYGSTGLTKAILTFPPKSGETAGIFGVSVLDILDYTNTNKYKTLRHLEGYDANGSGEVWYYSNLWQSTSAVTSITLTEDLGNFAQYSSFALYGIKGA